MGFRETRSLRIAVVDGDPLAFIVERRISLGGSPKSGTTFIADTLSFNRGPSTTSDGLA